MFNDFEHRWQCTTGLKKYAKLKEQLQKCLALELEPHGPLLWWKENEKDYKELAAIAKQYLAIQATSASSERMFIKANRRVDDRRARLDAENGTRVLFLMAHLECFKDIYKTLLAEDE
jgi:hypothetical protein